jgi:outer membrane lipoprotein-sorting protein
MKKIALLLFIFAFSCVSAFSQVNEILKRMDAHQKALRSMRADITISKFSVLFGGTFTKEGAIKFVPVKNKPPILRIDSTKPAPESFLVVGNQYALYLPDQKTAYTGVPGDSGIISMLLFLNMSKENLTADYNVK